MKDLNDYEHKISVRYEDLVEWPESLLKHITGAGDLEHDPDMVPSVYHSISLGSGKRHKWFAIPEDTNERYLRQLDVDMASVIERVVENVATTFDYLCSV